MQNYDSKETLLVVGWAAQGELDLFLARPQFSKLKTGLSVMTSTYLKNYSNQWSNL